VRLPNNMCASRQSTQRCKPNHPIRTIAKHMPNRSPHRSESVCTGA